MAENWKPVPHAPDYEYMTDTYKRLRSSPTIMYTVRRKGRSTTFSARHDIDDALRKCQAEEKSLLERDEGQ